MATNEPTAIIELSDKTQASLTMDGWRCKDAGWLRLLNTYTFRGRVSPSHPNPIAEVAEWAARELGGKVIQVPPTESEPGVVY